MAAPKPPYDPVKTVEGMFNGSVTRIAYAMKDPLNYAQSTKAVLAETAKKFQDALDDCEIQILEAKWYLEHQLALNKARREAKAKEDIAVNAKRKHEAIKDEHDKALETERENAPKRVKTAEPEESVQQPRPPQASSQPQPPVPPAIVTNGAGTSTNTSTSKAAPQTGEKPKVSVTTNVKTSQPPAAPPSKSQPKQPQSAQIPESTVAQTSAEELPKMTPQDTSAGANEDFNFVSMFGEPSGDNLDSAGNDMNFDLNLGNSFDAEAAAQNLNGQDSSLNSLLPGLESYANQAADDNSFNLGGNADPGTGGGADLGGGLPDNNGQQQINISDFSLPSLGPNEFDDLLNSNDMNFDEALDLNDDGMMNMENMDFDSMFN